jgi:hypothetical protein
VFSERRRGPVQQTINRRLCCIALVNEDRPPRIAVRHREGGFAGPKDWPGELQISGAFRVKDDTVVGKIRPKFRGSWGSTAAGK